MPILSASKRVVGIRIENQGGSSFQGVHAPPAASDALPLIRSAKVTPSSIRVDRPTLRLSLSDLAAIAPGKGLVDIEIEFELHATSNYVSGAGVASSARPYLTRVLQACGYSFISEQTSQQGLYAYALTNMGAATNPMRHGEQISGTSTAGSGNTVFGDTYGDDGVLFVDHGATALVGSPFFTPSTGSNVSAAVGARNVTECFGWQPNSTLPDPLTGSGQQTVSISIWQDGKLMRAKGCMGNVEFVFAHGDAIICKSSFKGVLVDYADAALPSSPNELHKFPPTFLGSRLTVRQGVNAPSNSNKYGSDGGGAGIITGALNRMSLSTGNALVLRENSMDPNGVNFATISDREPSGSFNPDEVTNANFDFVTRFISGVPLRLRCTVNGPGATTPVYNDPSTHNQNSFAFLAPGIVFDGIQDTERDGIHVLDASFKLTGGDYDTGALTELNGNDNEFVIAHF